MPTPLPPIAQLLNNLAQLPGVTTVALADTQHGLIEHATGPVGTPLTPLSTEQRVLNEAMLSAANQLAQRAGLGDTKEIHHLCTRGGLFLVRIDTHRWWLLHYQSEALPAQLRMALREATEKLHSIQPIQPVQQPHQWVTAPIPNMGELPKILFREQKGPIQVESTVYNSPDSA